MADDKTTAAGGPKPWLGVAASDGSSSQAYRWQSDDRDVVPLHLRRAIVKRRLRMLALASLFVVVTALFLFELLSSRPRTPLIVIAPSGYEVPFQPLSWSSEDVEGLRKLDRETLNIRAIEVGWKTNDQGLRQLDAHLKEFAGQASRLVSMVVYIRMHSAVDGAGVPCLVPPGASPFNSDSWLPVKDVLERLRSPNVPESMQKLIIFDCGSVLVDWNQGIVFNTFASRLADAVSAAGIPNLAVLNSNGAFEVAATSVELRRGVFGQYLESGLAGAADSTSESGNGDRLVSLRELHRYLNTRVNEWSLKNRGCPQRPQLIPANSTDFYVANVFNPRAAKRVDSRSRAALARAASISAAEIDSLWKKLEDWQNLDQFRFDTFSLADFEQRLRWLEIAMESGEAYSRSAHQQLLTLKKCDSEVETPINLNQGNRTRLSTWAKFLKSKLLHSSGAALNTLPLAEFCGTIDETTVDRCEAILTQLKNSPSAANLENALQLLNANVELSSLELTSLLRLWQRYGVIALWPDATLLTSAIELHELAEKASVPADERTLDWIRPTIEAADKLRRNVDDRLLLGGESPAAQIVEATALYHRAIQIAEDVSHAYAVRDELDHILPYLAQWLTRPPVDGRAPSPPLTDVKTLLFELARHLKTFETALTQVPETAAEGAAQLSFELVLIDLQSKRKELLALWNAEYERLLQAPDIQPVIGNDIRNLLMVPLLPAANAQLALSPSQQRSLLREKLNQTGRKLLDRYISSAKDTKAVASSTDGPASESSGESTGDAAAKAGSMQMAEFLDELLLKVPENLGLAVVRRDQELNEQTRAVSNTSAVTKYDIGMIAETQGHEFRQWMNSIPDAARNDNERQMALDSKAVFQNSFAERLVRASESVAPVHLEDDPIVLRRNSDLQRLLLWHSERVLADFLGPSQVDEPSYFDVMSGNLLKKAASIGRQSSHSTAESTRLGQLLIRYRSAAASGLTTLSDNLLLTDQSEPIVVKIAVYPNASKEPVFPEGVGAAFVRGENGERWGEACPLPIPWTFGTDPNARSTQFDIRLDGVDPHLGSVDLKAVAAYRGHDYIGDLTVNSMQGIVIDYVPDAARESSITMRGRKTRRLSMVFVLDCSNSMGQKLPLETDRRQGSRLQIAKLALQSMLDKLAEDESNRVGVICFGHRVGWDLKQAGQLLRQSEYRGPISDQTRPYDDVETILPLGRFNPSFAGSVAERMASIKPWGESPLYLAVIQALLLFDDDLEDTEKSIVVITDGMNNQFNPPVNLRKTSTDVIAAWKNHRVPINIVGLGIAADQAAAAQQEFGKLADMSAGSYVPVQQARTLVERLAALQRVAEFRVRSRSTGAVRLEEMGQSIDVEVDPHQRNEFDVSLGSAAETVILRGGEAIELIPNRDGRRLDIAGYEVRQPQFVPLLKDDRSNSTTELIAGVHRPLRRGSNVTFDVSIQHRQRQFVERPDEVWIEIVPIVRPGQPVPPTYVLYDPHYLPNTSVPVVRWTVTDWPADAVQAKLRIWCKYGDSKPASTVLLRNAVKGERDPDFALGTIPGVNARVRVRRNGTLQISVVERHSDDSTGIGSVKVGLKSAVTPKRVRHRFDAANRIASHFFEFSEDGDVVINDGEVQLTTRFSAHAGALRTADAAMVDVTESGDVHD